MAQFSAKLRSATAIRIAVVALIGLLVLTGYSALLRTDVVPYSPHSDVVAYHLATKQVLHRSQQQGLGIPYWRADQLSGTPAFTSPNGLYTNPLHAAFLVTAPEHAVGLTFLLQLLVAAFGCYLTGSALGLGPWPRIFLAVAGLFAFKLILAVYAGWLGPMAGISTVPFLFAAAFWLARKPGLGGAIALATSGALCLHGGQLQIPFYAAGFVVVYFLAVVFSLSRRGQRAEARDLSLWVIAAACVAVASTLYVSWPMVSEAPLLSRSQASSEFLQSGHRLGARHLLTLLWPEALGTPLDGSYRGSELWEDNAYFGVLPLLLASMSIGLAWRRPTTKFLAAGFLASLLLAMDTPLLPLFYALPGVSLFRSPARMLFLTGFFGTVLAGVGLEALLARLRGQFPRLVHVMCSALILLVASEGVIYARRYIGAKPLSFVQPATQTSQLLAQDRSLFRVAPIGRSTFTYGSAASQGLQLITGYEPYNLRRYQQYMQLLQFGQPGREDAVVWTDLAQVARWDLLDGLNVKYLLSPRRLPSLPEHFELIAEFHHEPVFVFYRGMRETEIFIYRNQETKPRVSFAGQILAVPDSLTAQAALATRSTDAFTIVEGQEAPHFPKPSTTDTLWVIGAGDGALDVTYKCETERFVVVSESWHPGWRATVDGRPVRLYPTNLSLMGTWLPAGQHRLSLVFGPPNFRVALGVSLCALTLLAAAGALHAWRRRRTRQEIHNSAGV